MTEESTTPDLVELTRLFYEVMDREWDFDALAGFFVTDAVWDLSESHLGIYDGVTAIRDFLVGYWATWEDHHHEIEEVLDFGNGVLSVAIREDGCPKGTHARVQARHLQVFEWDQRKIIRITGYPDIDEARAAAERLAKERRSTVSANLDLVRSIYADWDRGDFSSIDWAHPEIVFAIVEGPSPGTWTGLAEMRHAWREFLSSWEDYRNEVDEYRELDPERVLVLAHFSGRGKASGLEAAEWGSTKGGANLLHVRDGKVTRLVIYWDREHALADLGLTE
jgi:ketosteroid isomerase-like protein